MVKTCLEKLDYQYPIYKLHVTIPSHTGDNGEFISEQIEITPIKGHWEDITYERLARMPPGIYNIGDRMFYSKEDIQPLDKLLIVELDGQTTKWEVEGRNQKLPYWNKLKVLRYSYHLIHIQNDNEGSIPEINNKNTMPREIPVVTDIQPEETIVEEKEYVPSWLQ